MDLNNRLKCRKELIRNSKKSPVHGNICDPHKPCPDKLAGVP